MNDPSSIGIHYKPAATHIYPVSNSRYQKSKKEISELSKLPSDLYPRRVGLMLDKAIVPIDATLMGYNQGLISLNAAGIAFQKEAFFGIHQEKQALLVRDFIDGKLVYNATKLTKGEGVPSLILSQGPQSPQTISLFVKLLFENKTTHVLSLGLSGAEKQYCKWWPEAKETPLKVEGATLTLQSEEPLGTDCEREQKLVRRNLKLDILNVGTRQLTQYQLMGWEEFSTPLSFKLFDRIQDNLGKVKPEENILIHCHDGMTRSAVAALAFLALKQEKVNLVDLGFRLHSERPCVTDEKCVQLVSEYLKYKQTPRTQDKETQTDQEMLLSYIQDLGFEKYEDL